HAGTGTLLYRATISPSAFRPSRTRRVFHYSARHGAIESGGRLTTLVIRSDGTSARVRMKALLTSFPGPDASPLAWAVRVGDQCVSGFGTSCTAAHGRALRCD